MCELGLLGKFVITFLFLALAFVDAIVEVNSRHGDVCRFWFFCLPLCLFGASMPWWV